MTAISETKNGNTVTLSNGIKVPMVGIGTSPFRGGYGHEAVVCALQECGIRHIDTARMYQCEDKVAKSIRESGVPREEVFVSSKVWPTNYGYEAVKRALRNTLEELRTDYIDHYMLHYSLCPDGTDNPKALLAESWRALEDCYREGLCKSIGVSNFEEHHLNDLKETWTVAPHMNQIEGHVFNYPKDLAEFCYDLGIQITCYAPLAKGKALSHPDVISIAEEHHCTTAQVLIRWHLQKGFVCIPKSVKPDRVRDNSNVFHIKLTAENMATLDEISVREYQKVTIITQESVATYGDGNFKVPE